MTPAPISVERLRELLDRATPGPWGVFRDGSDRLYVSGGNGPIAWINDAEPEAGDAHADLITALPALLHQLAELQQAHDDLRDFSSKMTIKANQAERAREEATGLLRELFKRVNRLPFNLASQVAAFLAASGGA